MALIVIYLNYFITTEFGKMTTAGYQVKYRNIQGGRAYYIIYKYIQIFINILSI